MVVTALIAAFVWRGESQPPPPPPSSIGGAFHLVDADGRGVDQSVLLGKWSAVYFGYTLCPDTCPTTLAELGAAQTALGEKARRFQVVFVSVDPARDTPARVRAFLATPSFPTGTIGLTGTPQEVKQATAAYHIYVKREGTGPNYAIDHTSIVYLMDPKGRFVAPIPPGPPDAMARQIAQEMATTG